MAPSIRMPNNARDQPSRRECDSIWVIPLHAAAGGVIHSVVHRHYCMEGDSQACWGWTRDDRLGGIDQLGGHFNWTISHNKVREALGYKLHAMELFAQIRQKWDSIKLRAVEPSDQLTARFVSTSIDYGAGFFGVIEAGWRVMLYGMQHRVGSGPGLGAIKQAIADYDARQAAYHTLDLRVDPPSPSLYHDYYFNEPGGTPAAGMGDSVDQFRNISVSL